MAQRPRTTQYQLHRLGRLSLFLIGTAVSWIAALGVVLWLIGRFVSDRYLWSQFLLWLPTPVVLGLSLLGFLAAWRAGRDAAQRRRRRIRWAAMLAIILIYFGFFEHRLIHTPPAEHEGLHIVHWNAWPEDGESTDHFLDGVLSLDPDILILTDAWRFPWWQQSREWVQEHGGTARWIRPFSVISRVPLIRVRHLVSKDGIIVALLQFDTTEQLGRTLTVYAVDMPSDLKLVRMDLAREARRLLDEIERPEGDEAEAAQRPGMGMSGLAPDLVVGDFNITRNSAAMRAMFPDMRHAFDEAGYGYDVTFYRLFPLYHIDHVLLADTLRATRYDIIDPGVSRHRVQSVRIVDNK